MTLPPKELAEGQKAYELLVSYQRQKPSHSVIFLLLMSSGIWRAYEKDGWKMALWVTLIWLLISAISVWQLQRQKKRAEESRVLLANLKEAYGEQIYSEIKNSPHSLSYNLFIRRYPPFSRESVKLP